MRSTACLATLLFASASALQLGAAPAAMRALPPTRARLALVKCTEEAPKTPVEEGAVLVSRKGLWGEGEAPECC